MSIIPRRGGETYAEQCIQQQENKSNNGECENDINECVRKSRNCVNYDDSEKMTKCYRDAINWADKHCNSEPDRRQRHPHGETYAQECIQQYKSSGQNYSQEDVMKCLSHKCFNLDYDSDVIQKCGEDGINFIQNNYENSRPGHRQPSHRQPDHRYPDHRQPGHRHPDHRQPSHRQPEHRQRHLHGETYAQECIQQYKSSGQNYSQEDVMKCLSHKCFNLDYDSDTIQKCGEDGINFIQNNYDNSDFYGIY